MSITVLVTLAVVLMVLAAVLLVWLIVTSSAHRREIAGQSNAIGLLQQQLESIRTAQDSLRSALETSLQKGQENISQNLSSSHQTLSKLHSQIGELQGTNKQMLQLGTDVRRLQNILTSPKLRGQLGEWSLENLLATILPQESYRLQYRFKDGKIVDALVQMPDYAVPIDAKFPLPSFEAMLKTENEGEKTRLRRQFQKDVANHIDKIASSYIRPAEGTLDFALMYIPAENVYYETVVKYDGDTHELLKYALDKKVIPVSPNLLYAYLMTIVMGLHGLQIEKQAEEIHRNLKKLNASFADFGGNWEVLGRHLHNAQSQYEEADAKYNKFGMQLTQIQSGKDEETPPQ